jgi:hypothetical protein
LDNVFDALKEILKITDVLAFYGVVVKHGNKALCPLHNEKTPSFTIYTNTNSWHCFGCGVGGSVIDFVMAYFELDALEAAKKLDTDYGMGLFEKTPSQKKMNRLSEQRAQSQAYKDLSTTFDVYMDNVYSLLCEYLHLLVDWKTVYAPTTPGELDMVNPLFVEACHQLDYITYLIDGLDYASYDEQISFYQTHRKEMMKIAERIKRHAEGTNADRTAC